MANDWRLSLRLRGRDGAVDYPIDLMKPWPQVLDNARAQQNDAEADPLLLVATAVDVAGVPDGQEFHAELNDEDLVQVTTKVGPQQETVTSFPTNLLASVGSRYLVRRLDREAQQVAELFVDPAPAPIPQPERPAFTRGPKAAELLTVSDPWVRNSFSPEDYQLLVHAVPSSGVEPVDGLNMREEPERLNEEYRVCASLITPDNPTTWQFLESSWGVVIDAPSDAVRAMSGHDLVSARGPEGVRQASLWFPPGSPDELLSMSHPLENNEVILMGGSLGLTHIAVDVNAPDAEKAAAAAHSAKLGVPLCEYDPMIRFKQLAERGPFVSRSGGRVTAYTDGMRVTLDGYHDDLVGRSRTQRGKFGFLSPSNLQKVINAVSDQLTPEEIAGSRANHRRADQRRQDGVLRFNGNKPVIEFARNYGDKETYILVDSGGGSYRPNVSGSPRSAERPFFSPTYLNRASAAVEGLREELPEVAAIFDRDGLTKEAALLNDPLPPKRPAIPPLSTDQRAQVRSWLTVSR